MPDDGPSTENLNGGWIRAYRSLFDQRRDPFVEHGMRTGDFRAWAGWLYLLHITHYDDAPAKILVNGQIVLVNRGEFLISQRTLAARLGWTRQSVRTFLATLQKLGRIQPSLQPTVCHHKVSNYETYNPPQPEGNPPPNPQSTQGQPTVNPIQERREREKGKNQPNTDSPKPPKAAASERPKVPVKECIDIFFQAFKARHGSPYPVDKKDAAQTKRLLTWLQGQGMDAKAEFTAHLGEFFDDDWVLEHKAATLAFYCSWFKKALQAGKPKARSHQKTLGEFEAERRIADGP